MDPRTDRYDCDILIRLISGLQIEIMIFSDALPTTTRTSNVGTSAGQADKDPSTGPGQKTRFAKN